MQQLQWAEDPPQHPYIHAFDGRAGGAQIIGERTVCSKRDVHLVAVPDQPGDEGQQRAVGTVVLRGSVDEKHPMASGCHDLAGDVGAGE